MSKKEEFQPDVQISLREKVKAAAQKATDAAKAAAAAVLDGTPTDGPAPRPTVTLPAPMEGAVVYADSDEYRQWAYAKANHTFTTAFLADLMHGRLDAKSANERVGAFLADPSHPVHFPSSVLAEVLGRVRASYSGVTGIDLGRTILGLQQQKLDLESAMCVSMPRPAQGGPEPIEYRSNKVPDVARIAARERRERELADRSR